MIYQVKFYTTTRDIVLLSLLVALAIALRGVENLIPNPLPWVRIGLANIMTLLAIMLFGAAAGIWLTILRVCIAALFFGTLLSPTFMLSLAAGISSSVVMGLGHRYGRKWFSAVGISVMGGVTHNVTQFIVAYVLIVRQVDIFYLTPVFAMLGVVTGCFNGVVALLCYEQIVSQRERLAGII